MKLLILLSLLSTNLWAKPSVLVSYYDAFGKAPFNNSEKVAKALEAKFAAQNSTVSIKLCALNTIFDKAYAQLDECLKNLPERPLMVLGLGESNCELKVETMMKNVDKTLSPDNAGNSRNFTTIVANAPEFIGLNYPLPEMYCSLTSAEQGSLNLSNNAGSFVCNNTAYQMSYYHPEVQFGFIHVPASTCANLQRKTESSISILVKMINRGATYLQNDEAVDEGLPHSSNDIRLPTTKDELKNLRRRYSNKDHCTAEYLKRAKGSDEKRSIFFKQ